MNTVIGGGDPSTHPKLDGAKVVNAWYNEISNYNFGNPQFSAETGKKKQFQSLSAALFANLKQLWNYVTYMKIFLRHDRTLYSISLEEHEGNVHLSSHFNRW